MTERFDPEEGVYEIIQDKSEFGDGLDWDSLDEESFVQAVMDWYAPRMYEALSQGAPDSPDGPGLSVTVQIGSDEVRVTGRLASPDGDEWEPMQERDRTGNWDGGWDDGSDGEWLRDICTAADDELEAYLIRRPGGMRLVLAFAAASLDGAVEAARAISRAPGALGMESSLIKSEGCHILLLEAPAEQAGGLRLCALAAADVDSAEDILLFPADIAYHEEHGRVLVREGALGKLLALGAAD